MGSAIWKRRHAKIVACRYLEAMVGESLLMRDFLDAVMNLEDKSIAKVLGSAYPALLNTDPGVPLSYSVMSDSGSRSLLVPELDAYFCMEWRDGRIHAAYIAD